MTDFSPEAVTAAIQDASSKAFKALGWAAQKMAMASYAYQQRASIQNWGEWKKAQIAFEEAGLAYARAVKAVFMGGE